MEYLMCHGCLQTRLEIYFTDELISVPNANSAAFASLILSV
jgi:hypothetical protein